MVSVPESTNIFCENDFQESSVVETTSGSETKFSSDFGDSSCGEPLVGQHLVLDFTPNEEIDTEYLQKKCCAFWDFINNIPDIQNLMVFPEKQSQTKESYSETSASKSDKTKVVGKDTVKEKTAVSMLELVEEKGLINRIFEAKLPQSMCSLGSREYKDTKEFINLKNSKKTVKCPSKHKYAEPCICGGPCGARSTKCVQLKNLMEGMDEWDLNHPKSATSVYRYCGQRHQLHTLTTQHAQHAADDVRYYLDVPPQSYELEDQRVERVTTDREHFGGIIGF